MGSIDAKPPVAPPAQWPRRSDGCRRACRRLPGDDRLAVQIVLVALGDLDVDELADAQPQLTAVLDVHQAVDLRRIGQFVDVEITESDEHDLIGDAIVGTAGTPLDLKVL